MIHAFEDTKPYPTKTPIKIPLDLVELPKLRGDFIPDKGKSNEWKHRILNLRLLKNNGRNLQQTRSTSQINEILQALQEVYEECSEQNWDGYNATPVSEEIYDEAKKLIHLIPSYFPLPDVVPEPTGKIGLVWHGERQFVFVMSIIGNNLIKYAGIFGENNITHGEESFADEFPLAMVEYIKRTLQRIM